MTPRERFVTALLLSFALWCLNQHLIGRKVVSEVIKLDAFEEVFYPAVASVEAMHDGYEDYQMEASNWPKKSTTAYRQKRGNS